MQVITIISNGKSFNKGGCCAKIKSGQDKLGVVNSVDSHNSDCRRSRHRARPPDVKVDAVFNNLRLEQGGELRGKMPCFSG